MLTRDCRCPYTYNALIRLQEKAYNEVNSCYPSDSLLHSCGLVGIRAEEVHSSILRPLITFFYAQQRPYAKQRKE